MSQLFQPILSRQPEHGHNPSEVLTLGNFLDLLREEENYFKGEEDDTKLMITRLRKIFYDKVGWDTKLIQGATNIQGRYVTDVVECGPPIMGFHRMKLKHEYVHNVYTPKCYNVTYRPDDRVYGNTRVGMIPEIYDHDHADVLLPDGFHCDIGHVLAGLDAFQYPQRVAPFNNWPFPQPYATSNADVVTWLGDIATSAADFLFFFRREGRLPNDSEMQESIDKMATASDMAGNIDSFVIYKLYQQGKFPTRRVSEMLRIYYESGLVKDRFRIFTELIGLGKFDGKTFENEAAVLSRYENELRAAVSFMVYHYATSNPIELAFWVWVKRYEKVIKVRMLLELFFNEIKKHM